MKENVSKYSHHTSPFRETIIQPKVDRLFKEYNANLFKIFTFYAKISDKKIPQGMSPRSVTDKTVRKIRFAEFMSMIKDAKLVSGALGSDELRTIFSNIQHENRTDSDASNRLMTYDEFKEALAAVAVYRQPDPYVPLTTKLAIFITHDIIKPLLKNGLMRNKIKR